MQGARDGDRAYEQLYAFGARSFSIREADTGALVFDSGDALEQITADRCGDDFYNANTENECDGRSDSRGRRYWP